MDISEEAYLEHFGVPGMKWGVRKDRTPGVSRKVDREARKDAQESARAAAYYGKGAGTRRKLSKQTVEGKSKRIPGYKEAYEKHRSEQDTSKAVSKAVSERKRTDRKEKTSKTAGAVARRVTGEWGTQAAFVALAGTGLAFANSPKGRAMMDSAAARVMSQVNEVKRRNGARHLNNILNNMRP